MTRDLHILHCILQLKNSSKCFIFNLFPSVGAPHPPSPNGPPSPDTHFFLYKGGGGGGGERDKKYIVNKFSLFVFNTLYQNWTMLTWHRTQDNQCITRDCGRNQQVFGKFDKVYKVRQKISKYFQCRVKIWNCWHQVLVFDWIVGITFVIIWGNFDLVPENRRVFGKFDKIYKVRQKISKYFQYVGWKSGIISVKCFISIGQRTSTFVVIWGNFDLEKQANSQTELM